MLRNPNISFDIFHQISKIKNYIWILTFVLDFQVVKTYCTEEIGDWGDQYYGCNEEVKLPGSIEDNQAIECYQCSVTVDQNNNTIGTGERTCWDQPQERYLQKCSPSKNFTEKFSFLLNTLFKLKHVPLTCKSTGCHEVWWWPVSLADVRTEKLMPPSQYAKREQQAWPNLKIAMLFAMKVDATEVIFTIRVLTSNVRTKHFLVVCQSSKKKSTGKE